MDPTTDPIWTDVLFDGAAAREAADDCDRLADVVEDVVDWSGGATRALLDGWKGGLAAEFESEEAAVRMSLAARHDELRLRARSLRDAAESAATQQRRREHDRRDWLASEAERTRHAAARARGAVERSATTTPHRDRAPHRD